MYDVAALGELLIDFTPAGKSESGNALFERNPGGGPPNVLAAISRLGGKCAFMGMVGDDAFGRFLKGVLEQNAINSDGLKFTDKMNTTLAIVQLDEKGDRSFGFYGMPGPETHMRESDLEPALISAAKIFHFSSLLLHDEAARSVSLAAVRHAKHNGVLISYDPNYRPPLWSSAQAAKEVLKIGLEYADILKISETELELLTGECDPETGGRLLLEKGIRLVLVTLGPQGCFYLSSAGSVYLPTYDTRVVDTTGAGDAFLGAALFHISRLEKPLEEISRAEMERIVDFANAAGALCASKRGGIPAMPTCEEVANCLLHVPKLII